MMSFPTDDALLAAVKVFIDCPYCSEATGTLCASHRRVLQNMDEIIRRHDAGLPHPCPDDGHESHLTEEQREAAAWQRPHRSLLRMTTEREALLPLVIEWLDMEGVADSLAASEGADSYASQDTDEAARHLRERVHEALAALSPDTAQEPNDD